jgi:hypothetical protein
MQINQWTWQRAGRAMVFGMAALVLAGCKDLTNQPLPAGTFDPTQVNNAPGARGMAIAAKVQFQYALTMYIPESGLLTDEFQANNRGSALANGSFPDQEVAVDARLLPQGNYNLGTTQAYMGLQQLRTFASQAIGALAKYDPDSSAANRGELYAQEGYVEMWLADLFCSGVPLSTSDFQQDFTYKPGSSTDAVYQHAIALFDTALVLAADSAPLVNLARVGKARAQLALGQYAAAAQMVSGVPVDFKYTQSIRTCGNTTLSSCAMGTQAIFPLSGIGTMADREGSVGLPYLSSGDPRSAPRAPSVGLVNENEVWFPAKYTLGGVATFVVASGVEAQLIQAEADLKAGGSNWLTILNTLRTDGTTTPVYTRLCQNGISGTGAQTGSPCPAGVVDQKWGAGTGAFLIPAAVLAKSAPTCPTAAAPGLPCTDTTSYIGLPPLTDPGTPETRLRLLFQERAFWLYATGTRQGDLRRLVRRYQLDKESLYPHGSYQGVGDYSNNIDAPIPDAELYNPLFHGCLSRD